MTNTLSKLRTELAATYALTSEMEDLLLDLELESMNKFQYSPIKENITKKLLPLRSDELSINTGKGLTNHLINANTLDALTMISKTGKKSDVVFMGLTDEYLRFNDELVTPYDLDAENKWYTYIENRARLVKKIMSNESILFVTVDDKHMAEAKLILDKVFNVKNFVTSMVWNKPDNTPHNKFLNRTKEFVLVYKSIALEQFNRKESETGPVEDYNKIDRTRKYRADYDYAIPVPFEVAGKKDEFAYAGGVESLWVKRQKGKHNTYDWKWMLSKSQFEKRLSEGFIKFEKDETKGYWKVYNVFFSGNDLPFDDFIDAPSYTTGKNQVEAMFNKMSKRNTKPTEFYKYLINLHPDENIDILDINGDTATVGQAILEMNEEDDCYRTFTIIADEKFDGYEDYFAYERLKKQIMGYKDLKTKKDVDGKGTNLNVYTLVKKSDVDSDELFNSVVNFKFNNVEKTVINENLESYTDCLGNNVFLLKDTIVENEELKATLRSVVNLDKSNTVYIPKKLRGPSLAKELLSIGTESPKVKEVALLV